MTATFIILNSVFVGLNAAQLLYGVPDGSTEYFGPIARLCLHVACIVIWLAIDRMERRA